MSTTAGHPPTDLREIQAQCYADSQRWFPRLHRTMTHAAIHFTLGLIGEAGEVANLAKKVNRGDATWAAVGPRLADELADVQIYLCDLAASLDVDLATAVATKRSINEDRFGEHRP